MCFYKQIKEQKKDESHFSKKLISTTNSDQNKIEHLQNIDITIKFQYTKLVTNTKSNNDSDPTN